ncbi:MAG: FAD-dependent oxidoreductase [Acetobacteraceae bacterium]|nr:FAD-dependent oxidoreductase [Acetobacteraceae bacterium]
MGRAAETAGIDFHGPLFDYVRSADQDAKRPVCHPVIVIGAGPVGLTAAIDLARRNLPVVLLDDDDRLSTGSRAICFAKRTLEIWDRLGCGQPIAEKGVTWNIGRVFFRNELVYTFNLLPDSGHRRPAFVNIQQYHVERFLVERARELPTLEIRWKNKVTAVRQNPDYVELDVETPDGSYTLHCEWLVAADGARSPVRKSLGLESKGRSFHDQFLIADVRMEADLPAERRFWFDPPFHPRQSVLLHRQPDRLWRIDFQLGADADPVTERQPERVMPRVQALLGPDARFELDWVSIYTFACLRMQRFRHGRVLFAGDAAHGVSPFGARGANGGVQDADNLAWKLALVLQGSAPDALLDSYDAERIPAADENILASTRSTDFITPKNEASRAFRDATLELARDCDFARRLVNSGRLSLPSTYRNSPLNTPDNDRFEGAMEPGAPAVDAPIRLEGRPDWFLGQTGDSFTGLYFGDGSKRDLDRLRAPYELRESSVPLRMLLIRPSGATGEIRGLNAVEDSEGLLTRRYDARRGTVYLLRPDQHVCGRWRRFDADWVHAALMRACANA